MKNCNILQTVSPHLAILYTNGKHNNDWKIKLYEHRAVNNHLVWVVFQRDQPNKISFASQCEVWTEAKHRLRFYIYLAKTTQKNG